MLNYEQRALIGVGAGETTLNAVAHALEQLAEYQCAAIQMMSALRLAAADRELTTEEKLLASVLANLGRERP